VRVLENALTLNEYLTDEIQAMVKQCGARFEKMNINECTHLITTPECYDGEKVPAKGQWQINREDRVNNNS
jgi:hypothetical protein